MVSFMKFAFLVIAISINFFNPALIKSEEKIFSAKSKIENIATKESITEEKTEIKKIHIVKSGDTISSISKLYSKNKDLIIKLNNLKDENYIFVGQNLIISEFNENPKKQSDLINNYHIVQTGENLTDISNKYNLKVIELIEINNLNNPDSIKVGQKLKIRKKNTNNSQNYKTTENKKNNELLELDKKIYGPIVIQSKSHKDIKGRKVLNVLNQENKKLILSINCDTSQLDIRIPGRKWMGSKPAKEEFENNLINDFC
jgi:LysM repeat protein